MEFFCAVLFYFCGTSKNFQAASLKYEVVLINMLPLNAPITFSHQLLLSHLNISKTGMSSYIALLQQLIS